MDVVLIPAYEPDEHLIHLTRQLQEKGFAVVVVDDGSGESYRDVFREVKKYAQVLTHSKNQGKGAALKTGMVHIQDNLPQAEHFITCDADGQHKVEDVERVCNMLHKGHKFVLTIRERKTKIPLRSQVGNIMSRVVYAFLTKRYLSDNQSGLRGFSCIHIDWMRHVEKNNYDYEMNVLYYAAKKGIAIATIPIEAIYIDNNQSSHFNPIKDTIRIYKSLFSLARGQFFGFAAAQIVILVSSIFFGYQHLFFTLPSAAAVSFLVDALVSKYGVFRNTRCYDYWTMLIYKILFYFIYTGSCVVGMYAQPQLPLWVTFNLVYLCYLPLRYWLHKFIYIASRTRE